MAFPEHTAIHYSSRIHIYSGQSYTWHEAYPGTTGFMKELQFARGIRPFVWVTVLPWLINVSKAIQAFNNLLTNSSSL